VSEELTAEERAYALKRGVHMPEDVALFAKLVRLYDAALARIGEAIADEKRDASSLEACEKHLSIVIEARDEACAKVESLDEQWHEACAERDTALEKRHEAIQEQARLADGCNAALARIAELEERLEKTRLHWEERNDDANALRGRIARAVAELEGAPDVDPEGEGVTIGQIADAFDAIKRALEALR
jgi:DNA repair ATPase RecN